MTLGTYRCTHLIRLSLIALCATAAYSPVIASQETRKEADRPPTPAGKGIPGIAGQRTANLPDVPEAQDLKSDSSSLSNPQDQNSALLFMPVENSQRLSFSEKFAIYAHQTFGPPALIFPAFGAGIGIANPRNHYPREWSQGAGAYGRLYGDALATAASTRTARFLTGVALHEDPRYLRSTSKNPLARTMHAVGFTLIDKTDSGRNTIALSNFAGAAAGGFVGQAYLPPGFNDVTHAEQRMAFQFGSIAFQNIAAEFQPQWGPIVRKLRIQKIIPEWWVPQHD